MSGVTFGNYRVLRKLGEGGMGAVYAAEHVLLGRPAAVKVLLPEHSANQHTVTRFFNEARAATSIRHLGIVEIYDFGYAPDGTAYIAMELLDGESLAARMHRGGVTVASALAVARQIAGALAAAHQAGIVHRDLKPDNIFVIPDSEVPGGERIKLLDFGIAKLTQRDGTHASTNTGAVLGTPTYMAPEQCRGVAIDHRVDLYALGCILFEVLVGRPPFVGEGAGDVLGAHMYLAAPPVRSLAPAVPRDVEALIARLLAKDPAARPQTARELIAEIDRLAPVRADATGVGPTTRNAPHAAAAVTTLSSAAGPRVRGGGRRAAVWLGVAAVAVAIGVTVIAVAGGGERRAPEDAAAPAVRASGSAPASAAAGPSAPAPAAPAIAAPATAAPAIAAPAIAAPATTAPAPSAAGAGRGSEAAAIVPAAPAMIAVAIDSTPPGARVSLAGQPLGTTPYRGELPAGKAYRLTVHLDGHVDQVVASDGAAPIEAAVQLKKKRAIRRDPNASDNPF